MISTKKNFFLANKEISVSLLVAFACLFFSFVFPAHGFVQIITKNLFFLVIIPALYIKIILKKEVGDFGLNLKNGKEGIVWGASVLFFSFFISFLLIKFTTLKNSYLLPDYATGNFLFFLLYELLFVNFFLFIQDFFYRGFILFILKEKLFFWAVFIQSFVLVLSLILSGTASFNSLITILMSLGGGLIAYKSRSFVYAYLYAIIFSIIFDSYIIYNLNQ
ncbi:MAG TPA: hypothetical protein PLK35_01275 [Candidatus Moranbacteria bacterium]|nr:hypothetical protein [Candidatus Moranbacteria bacterium]